MLLVSQPAATTSFVGRVEELAQIASLLRDPQCRLLTLLGPGGIGKTRLALQAASQQQAYFRHGVTFVPLTPVGAPALIASAVASALQLSFHNPDDLTRYLNERETLLVLDNFEHLLAGSSLLADLLHTAPGIRLLVTSRERLNLQEEWVLALDGLRVPQNDPAEPLASSPAVQLFVQRARQVEPDFSLDDHADAVRSICQQVDGMPLALELAASWLRVISCEQIAAHITRDLDFLTTPLRNVPERHRSLRAIFEQSWKLLSPAEQGVLMRLSIFRGGFDLEAAEQVAGATLPLLAGIVDKSLVRHQPDHRFDLHELLRQYAQEKLVDAEATTTAANCHLNYFLMLAERAETHFWGREQQGWYDRLETELDNLRAALHWSLDGGDPEKGLRLAAALGWLFTERSRPSEGLDWLERTLAAAPDAAPSTRAKALNRAAEIAGIIADTSHTERLGEQAAALARSAGDQLNLAWAYSNLGYYPYMKNNPPQQAVSLLEESLDLFRELGDAMGVNHTLRRLAQIVIERGDYPRARELMEEALAGALAVDDKNAIAQTSLTMGDIFYYREHDILRAGREYERSLALFRELNNPMGMIYALSRLGEFHHLLGNHEQAFALYHESLVLTRDFAPFSNPFDFIIAGLASNARVLGKPERAARLYGAVSEVFSFIEQSEHPSDIHFREDAEALRHQLGDAAFNAHLAAGAALSREQLIAYALEADPRPQPIPQTRTPAVEPNAADALTERELEILRAVAAGHSNRKIAAELYLALGTVKWYLNTINGKLGVSSRTQAVAQARELGLLP